MPGESMSQTCIFYILTIHSSSQYKLHNNIFLSSIPEDYAFVGDLSSTSTMYGAKLSVTHKAETSCQLAGEKCDSLLNEVIELEVRMGISKQWQLTDPEYIEASQYMNERI